MAQELYGGPAMMSLHIHDGKLRMVIPTPGQKIAFDMPPDELKRHIALLQDILKKLQQGG